MNKLLIVLLAVCLVSVNAFVKRDAPAIDTSALENQLKDLQAQYEALKNTVVEKTAELFDPEVIKKKIDEAAAAIDQAANATKEVLDKLKPGDVKPAGA